MYCIALYCIELLSLIGCEKATNFYQPIFNWNILPLRLSLTHRMFTGDGVEEQESSRGAQGEGDRG